MPSREDGKLVFMSREEQKRDQRYAEYEHLMEGEWGEFDWFGRLNRFMREQVIAEQSKAVNAALALNFDPPLFNREDVVSLGLNLPKNVAFTIPDFMFLKPPTVSSGDDTTDERLTKLVNALFWITIHEGAVSASQFGGVYIKLKFQELMAGSEALIAGRKVTPEILNNRHVFPELDPLNEKVMRAVEIRFPFGDDRYLYVERHTADSVEITAYEFERRAKVEVPMNEAGRETWIMERNTLRDEPVPGALSELGLTPRVIPNPLRAYAEELVSPLLVQYIPNGRSGTKFLGYSDFQGHEGVFDEVNHRLSSLSRVMDATDDPKANAPKEMFDVDQYGQMVMKFSGARAFPRGADGVGVEPIAWDAFILDKWTAIEKLIGKILTMSEIALDLVSPDQTTGGVDSGRALRYRLVPTSKKRDRSRRYYEVGISDIIRKMLILDTPAIRKGEDPDRVRVNIQSLPRVFTFQWNEDIVDDFEAKVDVWHSRVEAGTATKAEAIAALDGIPLEEAEKKAEKIRKERELEQPAALREGFAGEEGEETPRNRE